MNYLPLVARVALSLIFLTAGIRHLKGFSGFVDTIAQTLPLAPLLAVGAIVCLLLGSISLILGYKAKIGAVLLIIFLVPTTLIYHNFLANPGELNAFLKNLGLIGGLLMVFYTGAGALSIDRKQAASQPYTETRTSREETYTR